VSVQPIASIAAAGGSAPDATDAGPGPAPAPYAVVSRNVTPTTPLGYTQTQTVKADGVVTTVITNPTGGTVDTIYGTSTMLTSGPEVSVWA
jgi:hypothetical protein